MRPSPPGARRLLLTLLLLLPAALAGCLGDDGPASPAGPGSDLPASDEVPPGCDPSRPAVAHHAGGEAIAEPVGPVPIPCFTRTGHGSGEPTMGITSSGSVFLYPASDTIGVSIAPMGGAVSRDAGASWEMVLPNIEGEPTHRGSLDPYMHVDTTTDRVFFDDLLPTVNCSILSWSDDEGERWEHSYAGCAEFDHQTVFTGPPVTSTTVGYPNVVYRCAINTVALAGASTSSTCQRSLDGGRSWLPPGQPAFTSPIPGDGHGGTPFCDGATGHGEAGPDGTVYLPKGLCGVPMLAISQDEGLTWERVQVADNGMRVDESGLKHHEAGVAVDAAGAVYYAWVAEDRMPYLATSQDGGQTWSEPMMVGPPGLTQASLPALTAGGTGKVAIAYMGSTNAPEGPWETSDCTMGVLMCSEVGTSAYDNATWNGYLTMTHEALSEAPTFYTAPVNDPGAPLVIGTCGGRCQEVFDFIDVVIHPDGTPWAPYVDGCSSEMTTCEPGDGDLGEGVAGRLWGGPSLWDAKAPDGSSA